MNVSGFRVWDLGFRGVEFSFLVADRTFCRQSEVTAICFNLSSSIKSRCLRPHMDVLPLSPAVVILEAHELWSNPGRYL